MQMSIVKSASRFEAKLLVSSALAEMIEDRKVEIQDQEDFEYDQYMQDLAEDPYCYDDYEFFSDEEDNDYGQYDDYYDPYEDHYFDWDY